MVRMRAGVNAALHGEGLLDLNFLSAPKQIEPVLSYQHIQCEAKDTGEDLRFRAVNKQQKDSDSLS